MGLFDFLKRTPLDPANLPAAVKAEQALEIVTDGAVLVDVRENHEWKAGHAREAIHIPLARLANSTNRFKGRPVVVVCASGARSRQGASELRAQGISATSLKGGMRAWQSAGGSQV